MFFICNKVLLPSSLTCGRAAWSSKNKWVRHLSLVAPPQIFFQTIYHPGAELCCRKQSLGNKFSVWGKKQYLEIMLVQFTPWITLSLASSALFCRWLEQILLPPQTFKKSDEKLVLTKLWDKFYELKTIVGFLILKQQFLPLKGDEGGRVCLFLSIFCFLFYFFQIIEGKLFLFLCYPGFNHSLWINRNN